MVSVGVVSDGHAAQLHGSSRHSESGGGHSTHTGSGPQCSTDGRSNHCTTKRHRVLLDRTTVAHRCTARGGPITAAARIQPPFVRADKSRNKTQHTAVYFVIVYISGTRLCNHPNYERKFRRLAQGGVSG